MKSRGKRISSIGLVFLILIISAVCMLPCLRSGLPYGDDQSVHMLRVECILKALKSGQGYPVYIYQNMLEGYGYGMGIFYPDLFLLPAVLFRALGASPEIAMKLYIYVLLVCTCITSYHAGKMIGGRRLIGVVTMILYTMGHYHLEDIYTRFALGEVAAMVFVPLVFLSLYDLTERNHSKKGLLCITFSCLLLSHTISFVLCVMVAVVWCIARYKRICANRRLILGILAEAGLCMLITCYYWLPVLEQFADGSFYVSKDPAFFNHENTMYLLAIVSGKYSVAFIEVGLLALLVFASKVKNVYNKKTMWCLIGAVILLVIETDIFPWKLIDKTPLVSIQFPWRMNMLTEFMVAVGLSMQLCAVLKLYMNGRRCMVASIAAGILIGLFNLNMVGNIELGGYVNYPEGYADAVGNTNSIGFWEWLPAEGDLVDTLDSDYKGMVRCGDRYIQGSYNADGSYEFSTDGVHGAYVIPKYYYKGYKAECVDVDGEVHEETVYKSTEDGLVKVDVDSHVELIRVVYKASWIQLASKILTLFGIVIVPIYMYISTKRRVMDTEGDIR